MILLGLLSETLMVSYGFVFLQKALGEVFAWLSGLGNAWGDRAGSYRWGTQWIGKTRVFINIFICLFIYLYI